MARCPRPSKSAPGKGYRLHPWLIALTVLAVLTGAAPAAAQVQTVGSEQVGLQPRETNVHEAGLYETHSRKVGGKRVESEGAFQFSNPAGMPVVSTAKVYAIYWDPGDVYDGNWQHLVNQFFAGMAGASGALGDPFAVDTQYTDAAGQHASSHVFAGSYTDTDPYPLPAGCPDPAPLVVGKITCLSSEQIETELKSFIADHTLPQGMSTIYYLLTPPGVTDCLAAGVGKYDCSDYSGAAVTGNESYEDSFCSYHAAINPGGSPQGSAETVLYAAIPWTAGGLGDYHVSPRSPATECQDGGWEPVVEGQEAETETPEIEPVEQEPNQSGLGPDGSYDAGLADLIIGQIATEQQNILTDPLLNAWQTQGGGQDEGQEVTDLCRNFFAPALGGDSGVESAEEVAARKLEEGELIKKFEEGGMSSTEAKEEAKKLANKKPHHGEKGTEAGTLYDAELAGGHYYLNNAFNLAAIKVPYPGVPCLKGASLEASFTAPVNVNAGEIVGFNGMESNITLDEGTAYVSGKPTATYPTYEWSFGDGSTVKGYAPGAPSKNSPETTPCELPWLSPCAASAFHSYTYGGKYQVTLTATDVGGNVSTVTKEIDVAGPPSPSVSSGGGTLGGGTLSGGAGSPGGLSTSTSSKSKSAGKSSGSTSPLPKPVATAIVTTTSLEKAVESGLDVRYSVNQQVAGHFEVLMPARIAKRLKIKGKPAKGLPPGAQAQTVIAYALLITVRGAHGAMSIAIPPGTGSRLGRLHHVTLTLRLVVRNADRSNPKSTLLQTAVKLRR
ncbi:MAG: PKD domain-containing protein [Solirubrobacteraceae bacterium]